MEKRVYENHEEYILDVLKDEKRRLEDELLEETTYLFNRYMSVKREINKIKSRLE